MIPFGQGRKEARPETMHRTITGSGLTQRQTTPMGGRTHGVRTIVAAANKIKDAKGQQNGEGKVERR